jgi:hypothetical protein
LTHQGGNDSFYPDKKRDHFVKNPDLSCQQGLPFQNCAVYKPPQDPKKIKIFQVANPEAIRGKL